MGTAGGKPPCSYVGESFIHSVPFDSVQQSALSSFVFLLTCRLSTKPRNSATAAVTTGTAASLLSVLRGVPSVMGGCTTRSLLRLTSLTLQALRLVPQ